MRPRPWAPSQAGRPLSAELGHALQQACDRHRDALQGFPVDGLLRCDLQEGHGALSLTVVAQLLASWVERLGADLHHHPLADNAALAQSRARLASARDALLEVLQLAQQLADDDCGRSQIGERQPGGAARVEPAGLVAPERSPLRFAPAVQAASAWAVGPMPAGGLISPTPAPTPAPEAGGGGPGAG